MAYGNQQTTLPDVTELESLLSILQLNRVPETEELESHFRQLIKQYHPDRNPDRPRWAHERSQSIIQAFRVLRGNLSELRALHSNEGRRSSDRQIAIQCLRGTGLSYFLPVAGIVRIAAPSEGLIAAGHRSGFQDRHTGTWIPEYRLDPDARQIEFVILYRRSNGSTCAILIPENLQFEGIEYVSELRLMERNAGTPGYWLNHSGHMYFCPVDLMDDCMQIVRGNL
ncbi:MAG: J domain-containing protein [Leptospiraceae bacterium]|nr:J domain-containing protein [Leptospiraceae bacterium]